MMHVWKLKETNPSNFLNCSEQIPKINCHILTWNFPAPSPNIGTKKWVIFAVRLIKVNGPHSQKIGMVAINVLPAITQNDTSEMWRTLSDKIMSFYTPYNVFQICYRLQSQATQGGSDMYVGSTGGIRVTHFNVSVANFGTYVYQRMHHSSPLLRMG
jgi:hypothetical protein